MRGWGGGRRVGGRSCRWPGLGDVEGWIVGLLGNGLALGVWELGLGICVIGGCHVDDGISLAR